MILKGEAIFDYLANQINETSDPGESSHWRKYHADFQFTGKGFSGLSGFGGYAPSYKGLRWLFHTKLQKPFRNLGLKYNSFKELDLLASKITTKQFRAYDLDVLRQVITLSMLTDQLEKVHGNTLVIGDGFASMTSLITVSKFSRNTILVNLTKTLFVDLWYLKFILGEDDFEKKVFLLTASDEVNDMNAHLLENSSEGSIVAIEAKNQHFITGFEIDIAINIASMQEMDISIVRKYISDLRLSRIKDKKQSLIFYCCNRIEKKLPEGEITRFDDYGWENDDEIIFDELCPWHQKYYYSRPPFYRPYDGQIKHRLVKLKMK